MTKFFCLTTLGVVQRTLYGNLSYYTYYKIYYSFQIGRMSGFVGGGGATLAIKARKITFVMGQVVG
jgi:hypothetical protein